MLPPIEQRKEVLLERFHSHTENCASCRKVRSTVEKAHCLAKLVKTLVLYVSRVTLLGFSK